MRLTDVVQITRETDAGGIRVLYEQVKCSIQELNPSVDYDGGVASGYEYVGFFEGDTDVQVGDFLQDVETEQKYTVVRVADYRKHGISIRYKEVRLQGEET